MSKMKKLPIAQATDQQIRDYTEAMDLDTTGVEEREGLLALLTVSWERDYILVPEDAPASPDQTGQTTMVVQQRLEGGIGKNDPKVLVKIGKTGYPGGKDPVPVSVNGRAIVIQRDLNAEIPYRYFLALLAAQRADVDQNMETGDISEDFYTNYPVQVLKGPTEEEIAAFHTRTDDQLMPA